MSSSSSVKVAVRVRPFNERELSLNSKCIIRMDGAKTSVLSLNEQTTSNKEFVYDASYWSFAKADSHYASQLTVFDDLGLDTIRNAFEGYNACVCAYGQTGSGKSYSMMGFNLRNSSSNQLAQGKFSYLSCLNGKFEDISSEKPLKMGLNS